MAIRVKLILGNSEIKDEDIKNYRIVSADVDKIVNCVFDRLQSEVQEKMAS